MLKQILVLLLFLAAISGCASVQLPRHAGHGVAIDTLQGSVNVSLSSSAGQMSGNGFLLYKQPDNFRLSILAPFGQVVFDIIVAGDQVTCLQQSRKTVWQGGVGDLPPALGTKVWPLLQWIMEPPHPAGPSLKRSFTRADGTTETIYYDADGLVQQKVNGVGDVVLYSDYRIVDGRAVANRIELRASEGGRLVLAFDDPELNQPIDASILKPSLAGYKIRPLGELNGFSSWK